MGIHVDASQVYSLAVNLGDAPKRLSPEARSVVKKGALEIKRGMQKDFSGHRYAPQVPGSLEFEMSGNAAYSEAKIGELDSAGPQWGLAGILAYGTSNNAPVVDFTQALVGEDEAIEKHLGDAAEGAALGGAE